MNTVALLIGLGPLLGWGLYPMIVSKIGGRPVNQILGSTIGTLIFAIVFSLIKGLAFPHGLDLAFAILSGMGWAFGQILAFYSYTLIGSSLTMPITTAFQLIGASLWGVLYLGNWPGATAKIVGTIALIVIIIGAYLSIWSEKKTSESAGLIKKATIVLAIGEIGFWVYSAAPQATNIDGMHAFLPQSIGMLIAAIIYAGFTTYKDHKKNQQLASPFTETVSYKHIFPGFFFAFAALTYLISAQPDMNGLATGFILSQTSVVLATLTSIWFLGQKKTKKEMRVTLLGLALILIAAAVTVTL